MNEPVADAVRSILDGHCVLSRQLAHRNHYPAIDVLQSVSRLGGEISSPEVRAAPAAAARGARGLREKEDLITIGAYHRAPTPASTPRSRRCPRSSGSCTSGSRRARTAPRPMPS